MVANNHNHKPERLSLLWFAAALATAVSLSAGCAPTPSRYAVIADEPPPPPPVTIYFYPAEGQSPERQDRDRYDCYLWARDQTGFEPSAPYLAPHHKLAVVADRPPGADTVAGAITGAALGAAVSSRGNRPEGALIGAAAGALVGSASDAARREQTADLQEYYNRQTAKRLALIERQAADYRRAMAACLAGKGYIVE
ncbi:MAG: glycine zipper 2TM domain-containing protein [Desulfobulbales bacterium]|nr:glycine zipper 2TM domain-containing protein [Desulfobulbales bacterium]